MKDSNFRISLDIHKLQSQKSLPVRQGDTGVKIYVSLTEHGLPYTITENCFAIFSGRYADGTVIADNCIIENNQIVYSFTPQTTAIAGIMDCNFTLYSVGGSILTAPRITVVIDERAVSNADTQIPEDKLLILDGIALAESDRIEAEKARVSAEVKREINAKESKHYTDEKVTFVQEQVDKLNEGGLVLKDDVIKEDISKWLDEHPEATTTVQDGAISLEKLNDETKGFIRGGIVNVKDFGAKGDGVTDDTQAIKDAVATLKDGDTLHFPSATYLVSFDMYISDINNAKRKTIIHLYNKHNVTIDFGNSTLVLKAGGFNYAYMVEVSCCENFTIKNGTLVGDKVEHDYTVTSNNIGHELGYGIYVNCKDGDRGGTSQNLPCYGSVDNCDISQFIGDAICTQNGTGTGKINIKNCYLHDCRRQGVSILSTDEVSIENTIIENIGIDEQAHDPKCGIDIEANNDTRTVNSLELQNVIIRKCGDNSILKHSGTILKRFLARNCQFSNIICDLGSTEEKMFKGDIYDSIIGLDRISPDRRGVLIAPSTDFNLYNCTVLGVVGHSIICTKLFNCRIVGDEEYLPITSNAETMRKLVVEKAYNCHFERIMLRENVNTEVPTADNDLGYFENCTFDTVYYIQRSQHEETRRNFLKCVFKNIQLADDKVSCADLPQIFDMCIFDTKLKPQHILNNCICMDEPDTVEMALDTIIATQNSYIGGA